MPLGIIFVGLSVPVAIFAEAGLKPDAERERDWVKENAAGILQNLRQNVAAKFGRQEDSERIMSSLAKAGISQPE